MYCNSGDKWWPITVINNNRPDMIVLDKTIKEACLTDVAIPNSHNLHSTIIEKLRKYTDLKEEFVRIWELKMAYVIPLVLSKTCIIPHLPHEILKLLHLHPALYITMQKAVIINKCPIVTQFLAEQ